MFYSYAAMDSDDDAPRPPPVPPLLTWYDAAPLVRNSGFNSSVAKDSPFARLPLAGKTGAWCDPPCPVRDAVWKAGERGAGMYLEFSTNASLLWLNASLLDVPHEDATCGTICGSGLDLYAMDTASKQWRWVAVTQNSGYAGGFNYSSLLVTRAMFNRGTMGYKQDAPSLEVAAAPRIQSKAPTSYRFYLPIYNNVAHASIGVPPGSTFSGAAVAPPHTALPPIVFYGTSIVEGHVASRPGNIFTNVLSRMLGRDVINLGFGGNGEMELSVGRLVSEIKQAALIVIDCNWNMGATQVARNAPLLVAQLRRLWSATKPIVLAEGTSGGYYWLCPACSANQRAKRAALAGAFAKLTKADKNVYYVQGDALIGASGSVDLPVAMGTHPDDLGHYRIASYYSRFLPPILTKEVFAPVGQQLPRSPRTLPATTTSAAESAETVTEFEMASEEQPLGYATGCKTQKIAWTDARTLGVGGRADWSGLPRENWWDRFPLAAKANVTSEHKSIWALSKCTTTEYVGFNIEGGTGATRLFVSYDIDSPTNINPSGGKLSIMPPLGRNGVDLYGQSKATEAWVWGGNIAGSGDDNNICGPLHKGNDTIDSTLASKFILYLPLWRACDNLTIGIPQTEYDAGVRIVKETHAIDATKKPIVWYGTSILHGAASTRAGAGFANRISRALNRTVYNFGFSGNGHMDIGVALWLAKLDAAVFIIDCNWNMHATEIAEKTLPIVQLLRAAAPTTPIVLVEGTPDGDSWFTSTASTAELEKNAALKSGYDAAVKAGVTMLHYVKGTTLFNATGTVVNPTVGGCHPNDLGTHDVAQAWISILPSILSREIN